MGAVCCKAGLQVVEVDPNHIKPPKPSALPDEAHAEDGGNADAVGHDIPKQPRCQPGSMNPILAAACVRKKLASLQSQVEKPEDTSFCAAVEKAGGPSDPALMVSKKAAAQLQRSPLLESVPPSDSGSPDSGTHSKSKNSGLAATWWRLSRNNGKVKRSISANPVREPASLESILESGTHIDSEHSSDKGSSGKASSATKQDQRSSATETGAVTEETAAIKTQDAGQTPKTQPSLPDVPTAVGQSEIQPDV